MRRFDQSSASCQVFTYKEGMLSPLAHDLRISVTSFFIEFERDFIRARFDPDSLRVDCAMVNGARRPDILSEKDRQEIDRNIRKDVLQTDIYRDIIFTSSAITRKGSGYIVDGELALHGKTREITLTAQKEGDFYTAEFRLRQPDYGIKPFSALLGAIKIKPGILVRIMVPARDALEPPG